MHLSWMTSGKWPHHLFVVCCASSPAGTFKAGRHHLWCMFHFMKSERTKQGQKKKKRERERKREKRINYWSFIFNCDAGDVLPCCYRSPLPTGSRISFIYYARFFFAENVRPPSAVLWLKCDAKSMGSSLYFPTVAPALLTAANYKLNTSTWWIEMTAVNAAAKKNLYRNRCSEVVIQTVDSTATPNRETLCVIWNKMKGMNSCCWNMEL